VSSIALSPSLTDGQSRDAGALWDSLQGSAAASDMSPSAYEPTVDQVLRRALMEPAVDSMQVLTSDPDAVTSLSLELTKTQSAVDAFNIIPLCDRLGVVRLHGRSFTIANPARSATLVLQSLPPTVTALDVSVPSLHESAIEAFVEGLEASAPGLHALRLAGVNVARLEEMSGFAERVLAPATKLVRLELPGTDLTGTSETAVEGLQAIADAIAKLSTLAVLDLSGNDLAQAGALVLARALAGPSVAPVIDSLPRPAGAAVEDDDWTPPAAAAHVVKTEREAVEDDWTPPAAAARGLLASLRCVALEGVTQGNTVGSLYLARALQCGTRLVALSLAGCPFGAGAGRPSSALSAAVRSNSVSLKSLNLRRCRLWTGGAMQLAAGLAHAVHLRTLNLAGNDVGAQSAAACEMLGRALLGMERLKDLDLSENYIHDDGMAHLAKALVSRRELESLGLSMNRLTGTGCKALHTAALAAAGPVWATLRSLRLGNNPLRADGMFWLCGGLLQGCRSLQFLGLEGCRLKAAGIVRLSQGLPGAVPVNGLGLPTAARAGNGTTVLAAPAQAAAASSASAGGLFGHGEAATALQAAGSEPARSVSEGAAAVPAAKPDVTRSLSDSDPASAAHLVRLEALKVDGPSPVVACLRSLDIHDNLLCGSEGGHALRTLLSSGGCDELGMCDARACCIDDESAVALAASLGAVAWKTKRMRLDLRSNEALHTLPRGLACLGELSVDAATVSIPPVAPGQDGAEAIRAAAAADDDDDDDDDDSDSDSGKESNDIGLHC
jgi:hypothetical protein